MNASATGLAFRSLAEADPALAGGGTDSVTEYRAHPSRRRTLKCRFLKPLKSTLHALNPDSGRDCTFSPQPIPQESKHIGFSISQASAGSERSGCNILPAFTFDLRWLPLDKKIPRVARR